MKAISEFMGAYAGRAALVMGLGTSVNAIILEDLSGLVTIGVNDIDRTYSPNYLLTLDAPRRFNDVRLKSMMNTRAEYVFTQIPEWKSAATLKDRVVEFKLGNRTLNHIDSPGVLDFSNNSPYVAVILAYQMGFKKIALVGVDFTDNHCHTNDGVHELVRNNRMNEIERDYSNLHTALKHRGCSLFNVSDISILKALPKTSINKFKNDAIHDI